MRWVVLTVLLLAMPAVQAQHCPWDCGGMILLQTELDKQQVYKQQPVLVDENREIITDTVYGTGKDTYDTCSFLYYDDFLAYRTAKINLHYWYGYDTVYHFAAGYYVARINYCKYRNKKIYLRLADPYSQRPAYRYLEINSTAIIHLHDHNNNIRYRQTATIKEAIREAVLVMSCDKWMLRKEDCR